jgi:hypothetical protein
MALLILLSELDVKCAVLIMELKLFLQYICMEHAFFVHADPETLILILFNPQLSHAYSLYLFFIVTVDFLGYD